MFFSSKKKIYKAMREKGCAGRQKSTEDDSGFPGWNGSSGSYINYRRNINHLLWGEYKVYNVRICV